MRMLGGILELRSCHDASNRHPIRPDIRASHAAATTARRPNCDHAQLCAWAHILLRAVGAWSREADEAGLRSALPQSRA